MGTHTSSRIEKRKILIWPSNNSRDDTFIMDLSVLNFLSMIDYSFHFKADDSFSSSFLLSMMISLPTLSFRKKKRSTCVLGPPWWLRPYFKSIDTSNPYALRRFLSIDSLIIKHYQSFIWFISPFLHESWLAAILKKNAKSLKKDQT